MCKLLNMKPATNWPALMKDLVPREIPILRSKKIYPIGADKSNIQMPNFASLSKLHFEINGKKVSNVP